MRVVFIGTGEIGVPTLQWLLASDEHEVVGVVTQPDKPVGRNQQVEAPAIKVAVAERAIPVLQPVRIKRDEAVQTIRELAPSLIVVMAYGQILPRAVLEIPPVACLNLHASLLPRHRGAAPIQAAILAGDQETGITVMYMDEGLDTGDQLLQTRLQIDAVETGGSLHDRLAKMAPAALQEALALLAVSAAPRVPQESKDATYAPKLEREHGQLDWRAKALEIERKIRAFDPWPGTYTVLCDEAGGERKLKIFRAAAGPGSGLEPGAITTSAGGIVIGAGDASLRLGEVQLEGKKRMQALDLVRGHPWLARATIVPSA